MNPSERSAEKAALRRVARERRAALDPGLRDAASLAVRDHVLGSLQRLGVPKGAVVSAYWPIRRELDPRPLMDALHDRGFRVALPVGVAHGEPLIFRAWQPGMELTLDPLKIMAPPESAPRLEPDLILTALLAFDRAGFRLGYGGGFYDRTIAAARKARRVVALGLAFSAQEVESVPRTASDARLDGIVTEAAVLWFAGDSTVSM